MIIFLLQKHFLKVRFFITIIIIALCLILIIGCSTPLVCNSPICCKRLPSAIISYIFLLQNFSCTPENLRVLQKNEYFRDKYLRKLHQEFQRINLWPTYKCAFIIDSCNPEFCCQYIPKQNDCDSFNEILFVTTPIQTYSNQVLVFISHVSPNGLTILSIDNNCKINIIYDWLEKPGRFGYIGPICKVQTKKEGCFLLTECWQSDSLKKWYGDRIFQLTVTNGNINIIYYESKL